MAAATPSASSSPALQPNQGGSDDEQDVALRAGLPRQFLRYGPCLPDLPQNDLHPVFSRQSAVLSDVPIVTTTDKVLDCILPPRHFVDVEGNPLVQHVEPTQVSREQLSELHQVFDFKLKDAKSRPDGLCPVRRAIYSMLFDELLRQVAIDSPERGLLLLRIRDEMRMTTEGYEILAETANEYSARKMFECTRSLPDLRQRIAELQADVGALQKEKRRLEAKFAAMQRSVDEAIVADQKKFQEEKLFLERTKQRLQAHLDAVKAAQESERRALRGEEEPAAGH